EAIPTLLQVLMHEDRRLRLLLVDLLAEIDGRTASIALAQRAVFDLSPEVRAAAVQALAKRPPQEFRHILLNALRYPWAPVADPAAEALAALGDREATPYLVNLLKEPDPAAPIPAKNQYLVREVVKLRHTNNCLTCHPPAGTGRDPVPGAVPGARLVHVTTQVRQNPPSRGGGASSLPQASAPAGGGAAAGGGYGGGGGSSGSSSTTVPSPGRGGSSTSVETAVTEAPLLIRADITYVRQDFSLQLPVAPPTAPALERRFDYVVRTRPISAQEVWALRRQLGDRASYPQREAVLVALRALAGHDAGPTTA